MCCAETYHSKCVDPWLTKTKKTCPVCKQKVVPSQGDSDSDSEEGDSGPDENEEVSESTPLLRSQASTSAHSFGTMSGASPSEQDQDSSEYDDEELDSSDSEEEVTVETVVVQMQQPCSDEHDLPRA
ncbi:E3 ubiquitin-protein ligase rnf13 [Xenoophorus captivus]|uniref:E3 ubiquitin-protein ligase rnf13 n=1 Tax=Xenoophorus captivus TaxID=1517983 RepID=A0ABV0RTU1_9TELE